MQDIIDELERKIEALEKTAPPPAPSSAQLDIPFSRSEIAIMELLRENPDGVRTDQIVSRLRTLGRRATSGSVRVAIFNLRRKLQGRDAGSIDNDYQVYRYRTLSRN
jgi:DNA-binding response OmpR family regulator